MNNNTKTIKVPNETWARGFVIRGKKMFHPYCLIDFKMPNLDDGVKALNVEV